MAEVVVTIKIMPEDPGVDLNKLEKEAKIKISDFGGEVGKVETEAIAFGLKALKLIFVMDESKGSPDPLEKSIESLEGVKSAEVTDVRRAIG